MHPRVQSSEVTLKVCSVGPPCQVVHAWGSIALEREERFPEQVDAKMVEERGELLLLPLPCGLPYTVERLGHTDPAQSPVCALPARVPLGPRPWLHRLRSGRTRLVRRLHSYYGGVRLLTLVHHRLRLLAFPMRTRQTLHFGCWPTVRSPGSRARSVCTCQGLRPRRTVQALAMARLSISPSTFGTASASGMINLF